MNVGFVNKVLNFVGLETDTDELEHKSNKKISFDEDEHFTVDMVSRRSKKNKISGFGDKSNTQLVIMRIRSFEEAKQISDYLLDKKSVVLNLESVEKDIAKRILDFLSGSVYTIYGNVQKVSNGIFLITPECIGVLDDFKDTKI